MIISIMKIYHDNIIVNVFLSWYTVISIMVSFSVQPVKTVSVHGVWLRAAAVFTSSDHMQVTHVSSLGHC